MIRRKIRVTTMRVDKDDNKDDTGGNDRGCRPTTTV